MEVPLHPYDDPKRPRHKRVSGPPSPKVIIPFPGGIVTPENRTSPTFNLPPKGEKLDIDSLFPQRRPLIADLGAAKGRFLITHALEHPGNNHIGIEWAMKYYRMLADRVGKRGLKNTRVGRDDAGDFVKTRLPEGSLAECHIYHPDPWPKKKHHRRRLVRPEFLAALAKALESGGLFVFQTDHPGLWRYTRAVAEHYFDVKEHPEPWPDALAGRTNYEIKALQAGWPVFRFTARPRPSSQRPDFNETKRLEGWDTQ